ncbi:energy transducer TonB [Eudoraea sp.]|uniref:energy transducer TonB n=1 Tax=Eudoraea sp. TaxID=1979955 RepID=UPI003C781084
MKTQQLADKELQAINWNDVDQYPLFDVCDEAVSKSAQRECFENTLLLHFSKTLEEFEFILDNDVEERVYVDFIVNKDGKVAVLNIEKNRIIQEQIPEFDGIISRSLKSLPPVEPALKRGIPVNTKCRIPIVLNSE